MGTSAFHGFPRKRRQVMNDPRACDRYEAYHPVTLSTGPFAAAAGTVISISPGGAAVRLPGWRTNAPPDWLSCLEQGGQLQLGGLIDELVPCRTVKFDAGVLQLEFARDATLGGQLREFLDCLAVL
jgi:hypothetical protein